MIAITTGSLCRPYLIIYTAQFSPYQEYIDSYLCYTAISTDWDLIAVINMHGCSIKCATTTHHLLPTDVLRYHEHFAALSQVAKKQWLLDYFIMNSSVQSKQAELAYMICGKSVCFKLWVATLDISNSYFYSVKRLFLNGHKRVIQHVQHAPLLRTSEALAWLDSFFTCMGDRMPDRPTVHLPSSLSKVSIYNEMVDDLRRRGKDVVISQSQFFEVWKLHFSHVTIPKVQCHVLYGHVKPC